MPAAPTYESIATTTLSSNTATVTFNNITQAYTDLVLITNAGNNSGSERDMLITINSDTGANYSNVYFYGTGSSYLSGINANQNISSAGYPLRPTLISQFITQFQNYSNTTTHKIWHHYGAGADSLVHLNIASWRSTAAITRMDLSPSGSAAFLSGSTFSLYGIKAA